MTQTTIRVCLVGLGHIGKVHVASIAQTPGLSLVAACDTNAELASVPAAGVRFHTDLDEALACKDIDVVVVATPNHTHNRIGRLALEAGHDVVIEKPAASDADEMNELQAAAEASGKLLWFAFHAATGSEVLWAERHLSDAGQSYGPLTAFHCRFMDPYLDPANRKASHAKSLQTPWRDSGINAISVLQRLLPDLNCAATGLRRSQQQGATPVLLSETAHFRWDPAGYGCIETAWDQQINHKSTELFFAHTGTRLIIDHSEQTVTRILSDVAPEKLAAFEGDRLLNHYLNLFAEFAAAWPQRRSNADEGRRDHALYFSALAQGTER